MDVWHVGITMSRVGEIILEKKWLQDYNFQLQLGDSLTLMNIASIPAIRMRLWKTSVQITALIPPW